MFHMVFQNQDKYSSHSPANLADRCATIDLTIEIDDQSNEEQLYRGNGEDSRGIES